MGSNCVLLPSCPVLRWKETLGHSTQPALSAPGRPECQSISDFSSNTACRLWGWISSVFLLSLLTFFFVFKHNVGENPFLGSYYSLAIWVKSSPSNVTEDVCTHYGSSGHSMCYILLISCCIVIYHWALQKIEKTQVFYFLELIWTPMIRYLQLIGSKRKKKK